MQGIDIYKQLFHSASEGMVLTNFKGEIIEINPRASKMFGYTENELIGKRIEVLIPKDKREKHVHQRKEYSAHPNNRSMGLGMMLFAQRKDESQFPVEISLNYFGKGDQQLVMALVSDITRRVEIELKIKELNEELERRVEERTQQVLEGQNLYVAIARNFPEGTISVFDKDLDYIFFEGKELYLAGIESDKMIGTSIKSRLPADVKERVIDHLTSVFEGDSGTIEFETKGQYFELHAVPIKDSHGEIHQILVVERNITKQKKAEDEMLSALQKERTLNELKSRFVSMASHEFRTPLSTVLSSISLIGKYNTGENQDKIQKHIGRIKSSVQNLTGILNDFLSLDKLEAGKIRTNLTEINIRDLTEEIIEEMGTILKSGQTISEKYDLDRESLILDGQIIKNILINLTSNAIKYSSEGKEIELSVGVEDNRLKMCVKDSGIGIPKEEQGQMFERFFRAKNVMNIEGTGLGLNIVYKYVNLLNGEIDFNSIEGKGTEFMITLPLNN